MNNISDIQNQELFRTLNQLKSRTIHDQDFAIFKFAKNKNPVIIDIGANRGQSIATFSTLFPKSKIYSFEANPFFFPILDKLKEDIDLLNIYKHGLSSTNGVLQFYIPKIGDIYYLEESSINFDVFSKPWVKEKYFKRELETGDKLSFDIINVELKRLDDIGIEAADIIKIDVEGAELSVLEGAENMLKEGKPVLIIENSDWWNVTPFLKNLGYDCFRLDERDNQLIEMHGETVNCFYLKQDAWQFFEEGVFSSNLDDISTQETCEIQSEASQIYYSEPADFESKIRSIDVMDNRLKNFNIQLDWGNSTALDVGGAGGLHAGLLAKRVKRIYCADVVDHQTEYNSEFPRLLKEKFARNGFELPLDRIEFNTTSAMDLIYRDALFNFVCSFNAFEHIPDPAIALSEIARVLKPGGYVYLTFDPIWTADTGNHFFHRVDEPWAHLVLKDEGFVSEMIKNGANDWEVDEYKYAMIV
jgi:FkbM family methyltransferase